MHTAGSPPGPASADEDQTVALTGVAKTAEEGVFDNSSFEIKPAAGSAPSNEAVDYQGGKFRLLLSSATDEKEVYRWAGLVTAWTVLVIVVLDAIHWIKEAVARL